MGLKEQALRVGAGGVAYWIAQREKDLRALEKLAKAAGLNGAAKVVGDVRQSAQGVRQQVVKSVPPPKPAPKPAPRPASAAKPVPTTAKQVAEEVLAQTLAGGRGALDGFTMGGSDHAAAAIEALWESRDDLGAFEAHRRQNMAAQRAQDAYDAKHYGGARLVGQIGGTGAQFLVTGPALGAGIRTAQAMRAAPGVTKMLAPVVSRLPTTTRIAEATPMIGREAMAVAGAGGLSGVVGQGVSDITRGKMSSAGEYGAAFTGGSVDAMAATRLPPALSSAIGGATTSILEDVSRGEPISVVDAVVDGTVGGVGGHLAGKAATDWADGLRALNPSKKRPGLTKGQLGEHLSNVRSLVRGEIPIKGPKERHYLESGRYTLPDSMTKNEVIESKFGRTAKLSKGQLEAYRTLPNYRVDHWLARDVGAIAGVPAGQLSARIADGFWEEIPEIDVLEPDGLKRPRGLLLSPY